VVQRKKRNPSTVIRSQVKKLLESSPSFHSLPAEKRRKMASDIVKIASYLADRDSRAGKPVGEVDFPDSVADLINGVFQSIVDASIRQMKAYAELVAAVAKSVDEFSDENTSDNQARDHLIDQFPGFFGKPPRRTKRPRVRLASSRQQLLATMVLMGINRIVVTDGKIKAKP
jgi:hypothetical protein